jgi:hypothetical protein
MPRYPAQERDRQELWEENCGEANHPSVFLVHVQTALPGELPKVLPWCRGKPLPTRETPALPEHPDARGRAYGTYRPMLPLDGSG